MGLFKDEGLGVKVELLTLPRMIEGSWKGMAVALIESGFVGYESTVNYFCCGNIRVELDTIGIMKTSTSSDTRLALSVVCFTFSIWASSLGFAED